MLGSECCSNPPALSPNSGNGHVQQLGGLNSYVSGPANAIFAVILIADIFGYEAPKLRKIADKVGGAGFYTVVPDFFHGDPYVAEGRPKAEWSKDHTPAQGFEDAKPLIEDLKRKGKIKIGASGFCWGAKVAIELAKAPLIQAGGILHPSFVTLEDIQGVKVPLAILGAELDKAYPAELLKQFEDTLKAKPGIDSFVKIFPGVKHGWSARYNETDASAVKSAEEAQNDMLNWFIKHVSCKLS